ncbi:MAG TPA: tripartite tricarboxylate transporter substrate binding protein [Xanthobacteraceae bacterium]|nr:tripartite tricarboxylate transporter substrate binding protein [Xanthobacteraceae bacterium]
MKLDRRKVLHLAAGAAALPALPRIAKAEAYPSRPVHVIVGYAASGPTDIAGRLISDWLSKRLNQQFVVEDRPGAGSNIATEFVLDSAPDGYTLLLATQSNAINQTLYKDMKFNYLNESVQIAGLLVAPSVMEVTPSFPAKTIPEFIAYAKANPGKINLATAGNGSPPHMFGELFKVMAGVNMPTVAYRGGGPALIDLLAGQVQVMFEGITSSIGYVKSGKLRALGVTSAKRSPLLPDVPAIGEFVPGYDAAGWFGLAAPKGTPTEIIDILSKEVAAALTDPGMKARMAELGAEPMPMTPAEFTKLMADETVKWGKVIEQANIKIE